MENLGATLETHISGLRRYARALVGAQSEADELVQECLVRALARAHSWDDVRDVRAYLFSILHNIFVDYINDRKRIAQHRASMLQTNSASPPSQDLWLELRDLAWAMERLPDDQRRVILLVGLEGLSYQQVASVLEIPIGTVMSRLSRGREALRELMGTGKRARLRRVN
jgi:RNA polymerase sigma-70 factor (ECF subfamily)